MMQATSCRSVSSSRSGYQDRLWSKDRKLLLNRSYYYRLNLLFQYVLPYRDEDCCQRYAHDDVQPIPDSMLVNQGCKTGKNHSSESQFRHVKSQSGKFVSPQLLFFFHSPNGYSDASHFLPLGVFIQRRMAPETTIVKTNIKPKMFID